MGATKTNKFFTLFVLVLLAPRFAFAQVVMTEIMYDLPSGSDSGREWIEVYNAGPNSVDLTKLKLFENGTNHKITATAVASTLAPAVYAVIADNPTKFKADWPHYVGTLFGSTFTLGNDGDTIALNNASSTALDTVSFTSALGAAGDGNSLNRFSASETLTPHTPSPGAPMSTSVIPPKEKPIPAPKAATQKRSSTTHAPSIVATAEDPTPTDDTRLGGEASQDSQVAAVATATLAWEWWLAAILLALASVGAIVFARRYAKDEWDIIEDTSE
ncbi:MAG: lamin tail domain-containing protein [bacterium]|nr:lamin tail domain-containing protein [bacterium]